MNKDQGYGVVERLLYGAIMFVAMKAVAAGWIDPDMAPYIAAGGVGAAGAIYAWWNNRPVSLLSRAGNSIPDNAHLVVTASAGASQDEKNQVRDLAQAANDKVTSKT